MEAARYARLHEVFAGAMERTGAERDAWLDDACGADDELRREVERLLAAAQDGPEGDFLAESRISDAREALDRLVPGELGAGTVTDDVPESIGGYRIVQRLAAGGMGVVYEARQSEPRRRVALKVLHPGQASPQRLGRFRQEARILGRLQHPGIAQIFEAGSFDLGRGEQPFYAMELVEGADLRTFADRAGLDVRGRLALLAEVCDAVHHAHTAGVVHRDLKPENVLVDGAGRPKVLDFGVALAAEAETLLTTQVTEEGHILGTLGYMAPEQVAGDPSAISPRTDVYSLGVLAWVLLTGELPLDPAGLSMTAGIRLVMDGDAPRLERVRPGLKGDVATIVDKALEKEPERRYASAEALASDLRRYLAHRPIAARPPSRLYRARKYARRHRGLVAAAGALALGVIGTTGFALYARGQERVARALEEERAESLYFTQMQLASGLVGELSGAPRVRELVERWRPGPDEVDRRGWEWRLLHAMTRPTERVIRCSEGVLTARWHPTRPLFATGERPGRVWDAERGAFVAELPMMERSEDVAWSPSGDAVALCTKTLTRVYETDTWRRLAEVPHDNRGPEGPGAGVTWHPSGSHLLLATGDGVLRRIDRGTWTPSVVHEDAELLGGPGMLAYAPDGERLLILTRHRSEALLLDAETWAVETRFSRIAANNSITCVAWSPDGARIALGGSNGPIAVFDAADGTRERVLDRHGQFVTEISWSPDGTRFLSASRDASVLVHDASTWRMQRRLGGHTLIVEYASWSADGRRIVSASGDGTLRLWDADRQPAAWTAWPAAEEHIPLPSGGWSGDGTRFAHHAGRRVIVRSFGGERFVGEPLTFDGRRPVWTADGRIASYLPDAVRVHDPATGSELRRVSPGPALDWWTFLAPHPADPDRLAIADVGRAWIADLGAPGEPDLREILDEEGVATAIDWSPDGETLLVAHMFAAYAGRAEPGALSPVVRFPGVRIQGAAWSPDGARVAFALEDLSVRVVDARDWREERALRGHANQVHGVAWSPDGARLASSGADGTVKVWEPAGGRLAADLDAGTPLHTVSWSPDGLRLTALGLDGSVRVWDAATGYDE